MSLGRNQVSYETLTFIYLLCYYRKMILQSNFSKENSNSKKYELVIKLEKNSYADSFDREANILLTIVLFVCWYLVKEA